MRVGFFVIYLGSCDANESGDDWEPVATVGVKNKSNPWAAVSAWMALET